MLIDVREKTSLCDYFIVASGRSTQQVKLFAKISKINCPRMGIGTQTHGGRARRRWGVLDYGDVIVHVFNDESRLFYHLERLWEDGENVVRYAD